MRKDVSRHAPTYSLDAAQQDAGADSRRPFCLQRRWKIRCALFLAKPGLLRLQLRFSLGLSMSHDQLAMQSYYGARAPEYDQVYLKPERQTDLAAIQSWLPPKFTDVKVLEIACGTGYWTQFIAPVAAHVLALDAAPETLAIARSRVPEAQATFLAGDAYALPVHLGPFDAAFAGFWFSHVPKTRRREFFAGLSACLRPRARVILLDNLYVEGSSSPITDQDRDGNTFQTRRLADGSSYRVLKNFPSEVELQESVAGFGECCIFTRWQYYWAFEYVAVNP